MVVRSVNIGLFRKMVMNGAINLKNNHSKIDELNVFPVPDGDTGTNMSMTVMSGVREMNSCGSSSIIEVGKVLSRGALMGARGNSGVILSQFFRGLYVGMKDLTQNELGIDDLMKCLETGYQVAYKAVMEPVEGTILTVVREAAEKTKENMNRFESINDLLKFYHDEAEKSLANTPNLLPVLKEAGVVDSGGAGFLEIVKGMLMALDGKMLEAQEETKDSVPSSCEPAESEIKYSYSTEFLLELKSPDTFDESVMKSALSYLGDHLTVSQKNQSCQVYLHTDHPGQALELAQKFGEFTELKIENMKKSSGSQPEKDSHTEQVQPRKHFALIAACFGEGICSTFKDLGVDYIIEGGQTMNPSTEAFLEAIRQVNADNIIIIPNNGNVIMAAKQAAEMAQDSQVEVLKAKTIAQGYVSLMSFDPEVDMETNVTAMEEAIAHVKSGELTYSIRDTEIGGIKISSGDFMGIFDGEIVVSTPNRENTLKGLLKTIIDEDSQIVTFFCGKDVSSQELNDLEEICKDVSEDVEVEIIEGKQDIYSYIIAVE